jgi:hypothetical protein
MSLYTASGTLAADGNGDSARVQGWVTCTAHYDSGTGTITWEFRGPDGVWRSIYGGPGSTTEQVYTATHMANFFFGGDVSIRPALSGSASTPSIDYQIISDRGNR